MKDDTVYRTSTREVEVTLPPFDALLAYRGMYALCTVDSRNKSLKATHYTCVLVAGPTPIWGVWTINGTFQRFFTFRRAVAAAYPKLVWRRKQATWSLVSLHDRDERGIMKQLGTIYKRNKPLTTGTGAFIRSSDQMDLFNDKVADQTNVVHLRKA